MKYFKIIEKVLTTVHLFKNNKCRFRRFIMGSFLRQAFLTVNIEVL